MTSNILAVDVPMVAKDACKNSRKITKLKSKNIAKTLQIHFMGRFGD